MMRLKKSLLVVVITVVILFGTYLFTQRLNENFSGSIDPSTRQSIFGIGPIFSEKEKCGVCS